MGTTGNGGMMDTIKGMISELAFFNNFESHELEIVSKHLSLREIEKDEVVFEEGEKGNYMCFVAEGMLNVVKETEDKKVVLTAINRGKSLGEMAMVDLSPRSATVVGAKPSTLIIMGRQAFDLILDEHPKIGVKLLGGIARLLSLYLRQSSGRLADKIATN